MNYRRGLRQMISMMFLLVLLLGCGAPAVTTITEQPTATRPSGIRPVIGGFGGRLQEKETFSILLIVSEEQSDVINFVGVVCAPDRKVTSPIIIATDVKIKNSQFSVETNELAIQGQFVTSTNAKGTVRALVEGVKNCGIPDKGQWASECDLTLQERSKDSSTGDVQILNSMISTENGRAFGYLSVSLEDGKGFVAKGTKSGSCTQP